MTKYYSEFNINSANNSGNSFDDAFKQNFSSIEINNNNDHLEEENSQLYFNKELHKTTEEETTEKKVKVYKSLKFNILKDNDNEINYIGKKTNRGRKKKKEILGNDINNEQYSKKEHTKYDVFNILYKIKAHSINCAVETLNSILDFFKYNKDERFKNINANFKKKVNKNDIEEIKEKQLFEIINEPISIKYKKKDFSLDYNKQLYEKIKENQKYNLIISILNETYLSFFQNIYYKKERSINLKKYEYDELIPLSKKVKLSIDKIKSFKDKYYIKIYNKCINDYYFNGQLVFQTE